MTKKIIKIILLVTLFIVSAGIEGLSYAQPNIPKGNIPLDISPEIQKQIERLYSSEATEKVKGAYYLGEMETKAVPAVPFLIASLRDKDAVMRWVIIEDFAILETSPSKAAGSALVKIGKPAVEPLIAALKDKALLWEAAKVLGKIGDRRAVEPLIDILQNEERSYHHIVSVALGNIGDSRAAKPLITVLKDGNQKSRLARKEAAMALAKVGKQGVELLITALADQDLTVREFAVVAVAKAQISTARAIELLIANLKGKDLNNGNTDLILRIRALSAWALGETGNARVVEPLILLLEDEDWGLRSSAASALGEIGDRRAVAPLIAKLKDEDAPVRRNAAEALGEIGDARAVEPLIFALKDDWSSVRLAAVRALRKVGDTRAIEQLIAVLNDRDYNVRQSTRITLEKITGERFGQDQTKWQEWWEKNK